MPKRYVKAIYTENKHDYLWNEKVDSATKILDPADCVDDTSSGGEKDEGVEAGGYETGLVHLLSCCRLQR